MPTCDVCGKQVDLPYECNECGGTFCSKHRLPENHDCPGLQDWGEPSGVFDSGFDEGVGRSGGSEGLVGRLTGRTGPFAYFRGNMALAMLALMWITFLLQIVVLFVLPEVVGWTPREAGRIHNSLFVLSSRNPTYVWTVITSIFAHAPSFPIPWHIVGNSFIVYFFGQHVEDYVGSKAFLGLFLVSGAVAGLGQVAFSTLVMNQPIAVLGASGAGLAIMGVMTVINPRATVLIFIPIPIPVPIWLLTIGYAVLSAFGMLGGLAGGIAHAAHLVGLAIGLVYGQRVKNRVSGRQEFRLGGGPGGPGGPRRRGPF